MLACGMSAHRLAIVFSVLIVYRTDSLLGGILNILHVDEKQLLHFMRMVVNDRNKETLNDILF